MVSLFVSPAAAALLRWIAFCTASIVVGAVAYHAIVREGLHTEPQPRLRRMVRGSAWGLLLASAGRMAQQALSFASEPSEAGAMVGTLLGTAWGYAWVAQVIATMVFLFKPGLAAEQPRTAMRSLMGGVVAASLVTAPAFQGHAIGSQQLQLLAIIGDIAHLVAAGVWMGTLLVIVVVGLPGSDALRASAMIRAFSPWALTSAAILGATGLFASWLHVRHPPLVWGSIYGRVLCIKVALVAGVVALGAINWKRLTPQLAAPGGVARLGAAARGELVLAAGVFVMTAILVATPLPNE